MTSTTQAKEERAKINLAWLKGEQQEARDRAAKTWQEYCRSYANWQSVEESFIRMRKRENVGPEELREALDMLIAVRESFFDYALGLGLDPKVDDPLLRNSRGVPLEIMHFDY